MADECHTVLLANEEEAELKELAELVEGAGHEVVALAITASEAADAIVEHRPTLAMILVDDDEGHALELIVEIRSFADIPLVVLARSVSDETLQRAADRALEVLHVPSRPETVAQVIRVAAERHADRKKLESRVGEIDGIVERRATIEQAKGILMERHGVGAVDAFEMIREHARENQLRVVDVAASVIAARDLLTATAPEAGERTTAEPESRR